jgi:hypothetical protein
LQTLVKEAHRNFYLTPWRLAKLVRLMPHKAALIRGGLRLAYRGFLGKG